MPRPDADHAAPGARAHQRADLHQLEAVREDVAVGAGVLVGQRHDRAQRRLVRVGRRPHPARGAVADALARELLQQELRDVAAAVVAHVDDQRRRGRIRRRSSDGTRRSPPTSCPAGAGSRRGPCDSRAPTRGCARPTRGSAPAPRRRASCTSTVRVTVPPSPSRASVSSTLAPAWWTSKRLRRHASRDTGWPLTATMRSPTRACTPTALSGESAPASQASPVTMRAIS